MALASEWIGLSSGVGVKIMGKTKDTSRELANVELDTVTGGLVVAAINQPLIALDIGRPPPPQTLPRWRPGTTC